MVRIFPKSDRRLDVGRAASLVALVAPIVVACLTLGTAPAAAEEGDRLLGEEGTERTCPDNSVDANGDAKRLTLLGVSCFKSGRYAQAYTFYYRAYQHDESDLLRAAMGRSLHELGIYGPARSYYEAFLEGKRGRESAEKIEDRLDQLRDDIDANGATARLTSFPSGARVHLELDNGEWVEIGRTPTEAPLEQGTYTFKYERPGYSPRTVSTSVQSASSPTTVDAELYHLESEFDARGHRVKKAGMYTILASLPVLTGGGVLFGLSADKFAEAEDYTFDADYVPAEQNRMVEQAHVYQQWAIGVSAAGGAALLTGGILFFRGQAIESRSAAERESASLRPVVSPRFVGIRARF